MGGSPPAQQVVRQEQQADPWGAQQPYLRRGFEEAEREILEQPRSYFPGSTVVPFAPETEAALGLQTARAIGGSPINMAASQELQRTLGGGYLGMGNPYFQGMVERAVQPLRREYEETILPGIQSQFAGAGRYGSGAMGRQMGRAAEDYMRTVGEIGTGLAFPTYEAERTAMQRGLAFAPQIAAQDYADIERLGQVGAAREQLSGQQLQEQIARHNFEQQEAAARLAQYMNLIQGTYGGQQTGLTTQPQYARGMSPILGGLGGALGGAATGAMLGSVFPGIGTGIGALGGAALGGGLGLFS